MICTFEDGAAGATDWTDTGQAGEHCSPRWACWAVQMAETVMLEIRCCVATGSIGSSSTGILG